MRSPRKITALAMAGALSVGLLAACVEQHRQRRARPTTSTGDEQGHHHGRRPAAHRRRRGEAAARRARRLVRGEVPEHQGRAAGLRVARVDVHHPARRWHAAERLRDPADRRQDAHRERPARRHRHVRQGAPVRRATSTTEARSPTAPARTARSTPSRPSRSTRSRCTTTASCSSRPGSTPTSRRRRGTRSAQTPRQIHDATGVAGLRDDGARQRGRLAARGRCQLARRRHRDVRRHQVHRHAQRPGGQGAPRVAARRCAGRTTRCWPAPTSAGARSTRRSPAASSRCTRRAPTSTTRWWRATASPRTGATASPRSRPTNGGGALTGGTLAAVTKDSTDAQKDAAVKWIDWWYLSKLQDQDAGRRRRARSRAEAEPAAGRRHPGAPDLLQGALRAEPGAGSRTTSTSRSTT